MIRLQFDTAIFLYLLITIFSFLVVWLIFFKIKMPSQRRQMEVIWQCFICAYIYVDSRNKRLSVCPRCRSYNEKGGAS